MARSRELSKIFSSDTLVSLDNEIQSNIIIQAESEQTANLLELRNSSGSVVSSIGPTGALTGIGKILQIVRATDTTNRSTTSTGFVDVTGLSVSITPQKSNSKILIIASVRVFVIGVSNVQPDARITITDSSNNIIDGSTDGGAVFTSIVNGSFVQMVTLFGLASPNTTSAVSYKVRFKSSNSANSTINVENNFYNGQIYAIEVAA